ncbi:Cytochrome c oxidase assembly protein cox19 [Endocarpon pusillum]|uniref:Cytochrome c oxidase assembly protein cox19 n=1 Tax=Endocarpon pusillum TaxID=364733 RepID=A0A8H7A7P4_9EURO|nr:Cytochrome c oxidase assembly protein cox19 [Endocarpon pusillum]
MSFGAPGGRALNIKPTPPERGSFPLDHDAECKHLISSYLRCLKKPRHSSDSGKIQAGINDEECRLIAKDYLQCRMDKNLMAKDEMKNLGLEFPSQPSGEVARKADSTRIGEADT